MKNAAPQLGQGTTPSHLQLRRSRPSQILVPLPGPPQLPEDARAAGEAAGKQRDAFVVAATDATVSRQGPAPLPDVPTEEISQPEGDRYQLGAQLGVGGSGRVIAATDREIGRTVALKMPRPLGFGRAAGKALRRFRDEARITARLEHPNIIPIYDVGVLRDGMPFYTMRVVERHSLRDVLRLPAPREAWPLARLCTLLVQVCRAIGYAHARGVLHRDLKPDNILLGEFGEVYVADWGIAKLLAHELESEPGTAVSEPSFDPDDHTAIGSVLGTLGYMAPEQTRGEWEEVDRRADLFALGVILYESLCGRHPFRSASGSSREEVQRAVQHEEPPLPRTLAPGCPLVLEGLCCALLAKKKEDRPDSAESVATEIEAFLEGAKEKERRRREAAALAGRARAPLERHERLGEERRKLIEEANAKRNAMRSWEPVEAKRAAWQLEDRAAQLETARARVLAEAMELYQQALAHDPVSPEARAGLADLYWSQAREAETMRDEPRRIYYESMVRDHDGGRYAALLSADAHVSLTSDPPGAEVLAYRYVEVDRTLRPVEERHLGVTPVREARFAPGTYLLVLRHPGARDVRYPLMARRGDHQQGHVNLYSDAEIGADFIYVPGGASYLGGDEEARGQPLQRTQVQVEDFAIARFPVTFGEYLAFLNQLQASDPAACRRRLPVGKDGRMPVKQDEGGQWVLDYEDLVEGLGRKFCPPELGNCIAMMPLSWYDARAYAAWRGARDGLSLRLPSEAEFEKAARGVDERIYPWGNRFDATFAKMRESRPGFSQAEAVGAFPLDESPYGVRDLGGGMAAWVADVHGELCADAADAASEPPEGSPLELAGERVHRGGSWLVSAEGCRSATRVRYFGSFRPSECGMRLARSLPRRTP